MQQVEGMQGESQTEMWAAREGPFWNLPRSMYRAIVTLHGSPEDIALGTALGFFVAFTPTLGFQIFISVILATCLRASRAAAFIPIWITNVFTAVPIYAFTYMIGAFFWPGPSAGEVYQRLKEAFSQLGAHSFYHIEQQFGIFLELGMDIFIPMTVGGFVVGGISGLISYPFTLRAVRSYQAHRREKKEQQSSGHALKQ